jgi:hypothetical protein
MINPGAVMRRNIAFYQRVVGHSDVLVAFDFQFLGGLLRYGRNVGSGVQNRLHPGDFDRPTKE